MPAGGGVHIMVVLHAPRGSCFAGVGYRTGTYGPHHRYGHGVEGSRSLL